MSPPRSYGLPVAEPYSDGSMMIGYWYYRGDSRRAWVMMRYAVARPPIVKVDLRRPQTWLVMGIRGSGKSSLLEVLAETHLASRIGPVVDLFGSRDGEGLAWLRSPLVRQLYRDTGQPQVLLVTGKGVTVEAEGETAELFEAREYTSLTLADIEKHAVTISAAPLYNDIDEEYESVNRIIRLLYNRFSWKQPIFVLVREAAQLYYSRLRISRRQADAKAQTVYLVREARHMGITLGLDTGKYTSIESEIRFHTDFIAVKRQGVYKLPEDLSWLYTFFDPTKIHNLPVNAYILISKEGMVAVGIHDKTPWHKEANENILETLKLKIIR